MIAFLHSLVNFWDGVVIWYFAFLNLFYGLLFLLSIGETWKNWALTSRLHLSERMDAGAFLPISIIIPAHNEVKTIEESIRAQLNLDYPLYELVVVNDGSTDGTLERLNEAFDLYEVPPAFPCRLKHKTVLGYYRSHQNPGLVVVDKENGGKADALNAGLNIARYPLCATVDADTLTDTRALKRVVRPFLLGSNAAGAGGTIRVANGCMFSEGKVIDPRVPKRFLAGVQVPEYLRAFLFGRLGWNRLGGNLLVSGAFALFQRRLVLDIGGYKTDSITEDLELTVSMHRDLLQKKEDYTLPFVPDPVAWTEVPEDLKSLGNQRERWHRGLLSTLLHHKKMLGNPRYGRIGLIAFPFYFFGELLAPLVEMFGYFVLSLGIVLGILDYQYAILFFSLALGYLMFLTFWTILLEEMTYRVYPHLSDFLRMLLYALLEPFGYRQFTLFWRLRGFWNALRNVRSWGFIHRRGVSNSTEVHDPAP